MWYWTVASAIKLYICYMCTYCTCKCTTYMYIDQGLFTRKSVSLQMLMLFWESLTWNKLKSQLEEVESDASFAGATRLRHERSWPATPLVSTDCGRVELARSQVKANSFAPDTMLQIIHLCNSILLERNYCSSPPSEPPVPPSHGHVYPLSLFTASESVGIFSDFIDFFKKQTHGSLLMTLCLFSLEFS